MIISGKDGISIDKNKFQTEILDTIVKQDAIKILKENKLALIQIPIKDKKQMQLILIRFMKRYTQSQKTPIMRKIHLKFLQKLRV